MDKVINLIIDNIINNFDFGFMFVVNVATYIMIKIVDHFNGDAKVPTYQKRLLLVIAISFISDIYFIFDYTNVIVLINSAILAPVFWSWVASPILKRLGIGYKDIDNTLN